ncbi:3-hydroxyphenylacetate 6-hydroxylase [Sphaceloma murrayae]|uniref:3-hydroxyphenylacetate 6-hydroxylase n=1 Tax=Sphaceloma murrayae TaxID=2082308 RepID=A0A2K1QH45_9PEZI|nr:3-hydroxyphenylacetate 6-hydroxylase [Sphaceloma murrayae]
MATISAAIGSLSSNIPAVVGAVLVTTVLSALGFYLYNTPSSWKDSRRKKLPPGPGGLPFVGNLMDMADAENFHEKAVEWGQNYGDLTYTRMGGTDYVWLNTPKAVKDIMDKRSSIYSSRPPAPLASDVASAGRRQLFLPYGPHWKGLRKSGHVLLNLNAAVKYQPIQDFESKQLMVDLLESPASFYDHNRRYSSSLIFQTTYGYRIKSFDDPRFKQIYAVLNSFTQMSAPGAYAVDSFPSLAALPDWMLGGWRKFGKQCFDQHSKVYLELWLDLKKQVEAGTAKECFCKDYYLSDLEKQGIDDLQAAYMCGGMLEAGSETTSSTLNNFTFLMTQNPHAVKAAQEELDRVVGPNRLPTWEDEPKLPYVRALIKEVLRHRPPNKFGIGHSSSEDDWYEGFFMPKGTVVMINWWAIHRDDKRYPDPMKFEPARYINHSRSAAEYAMAGDPNERDHFSYGSGRRICQGIHLAEKSLFINIARQLWGFNISKTTRPDGSEIEPHNAWVPGWMCVPQPFQASITPRSKKHESIMRKEFEIAEAQGLEIKA